MAHHLTDLTIELDEKVGTVAAAAEALGKAGVNIEGICGFVVGGKGVGHVLVDASTLDSELARHGLAPVVPTSVARPTVEIGRRVSANGLYVKA